MALDFYKTPGGRRFIDATVPNLIRTIEQLEKTVATLCNSVDHMSKQLTPAPNPAEDNGAQL